MPLLSSMAPASRWKVLLYGAPKSGKTELYGELANHGYRLHVLDLEGGYKALQSSPRITEDAKKNIFLYVIPDTLRNPVAANLVHHVLLKRKGTICVEHGRWDCPVCTSQKKPVEALDISAFTQKDILVIDSFSQLAASCMAFIYTDEIQKDQMVKPDWDAYNKQGFLMVRINTGIQAANFNIICTAHETTVKTESGAEKLGPSIGTRDFSAANAGKVFDDVVYCGVTNKTHKIGSSTTYSSNVLTGARSGVVLEKAEKLSLRGIFDEKTGGAKT